MQTKQFLIIFAVAAGALFLGASLYLHLQARSKIPPEVRPKWQLMAGLMAFFLVGYVFFLFARVEELIFPLEDLTAAVFFGGALFVFVVTRITLKAMAQIVDHERQLQKVNEELMNKNRDLEEEISRRMEAEERANIHLKHLTSLHDIDTMISASLDLGVTLKVFLDQLIPQLGIDAADVMLFDPYTQTVAYAAGIGFTSDKATSSRDRLGQGSAGQAAIDRKMGYIPDLQAAGHNYSRPELAREEGFVSYCALPLVAKGTIQGVLELYRRRFFKPDHEWLEFLQSLAIRVAIAIENSALFNQLQRSNAELILAYDTTIEGWSHALELRDKETQGHTQRVVNMTKALARKLGMTDEQLVHLTRGALLHDIGKMAIPDEILMKKGPLTASEMVLMQKHPVYAMELLSPIAYLQPALDIPYCHHEHWDGSGYPRGLRGAQIPLAARIFAVADTWDALINARRYHKAWPREKVCKHIEEQSGSHFDPEIAKLFLQMDWCFDDCELPSCQNQPVP